MQNLKKVSAGTDKFYPSKKSREEIKKTSENIFFSLQNEIGVQVNEIEKLRSEYEIV